MPAEILRIASITGGAPYHATLASLPVGVHGTGLHGHADFYEVMGVVAGQGRHRLENGGQDLAAGDVVVVRPGDRHAFRAAPPDGLQFVNVAFPAAAWRAFLPLVDVGLLEEWDRSPKPPLLRFGGTDRLRAEHAFRQVLAEARHGPANLHLIRFWLDVAELAAGGASTGDETGQPSWLARACLAMRQEDNLRAGLPRLLELAAVSPAHLSRSVRTHHGTTPTELVMRARLDHAATLLLTTSLQVTQIGIRCGFSSTSYFSRCFHAAHGVAPRVFRERHRRAVVP